MRRFLLKTLISFIISLSLLSLFQGLSYTTFALSLWIAVFINAFLSIFSLRETEILGVLLIDTSDPEKDLYQLNFGPNLERLRKEKTVMLKIDLK